MNSEVSNIGGNLKALVDYYVNTFVSPDGKSEDLQGLHEVVIGTMEKFLITSVLEKCNGNKIRAAKILGLHRNTLSQKTKIYALEESSKLSRTKKSSKLSVKKKALPKVVLLKRI